MFFSKNYHIPALTSIRYQRGKENMKLTCLLQKNVVAFESSSILGCIKNVYFTKDCLHIAYFLIEDENKNLLLLSPDKLLSCQDAVIVKNNVCAKRVEDVDFTAFSSGIIGMDVYTQSGILKGQVQEVDFAKSGKITRIHLEEHFITPSAVYLAGDVILLKAQKRPFKSQKVRLPRPHIQIPVSLFEENDTANLVVSQDVATPNRPQSSDAQLQTHDIKTISSTRNQSGATVLSAPKALKIDNNSPLFSQNAMKVLGAPYLQQDGAIARIISDYDFLLGRTLCGDLYSYIGVQIAKKGDIVTHEVISLARKAGKLAHLVLLAQ